MLEKIGLPAKPSMRGSNWVIDASHCQGCSSQFTFLNRKHHCRRCGGLFCNSCTQQRIILRGQGDSPVRICDPCKKLEEASRFEMRYGHKNRAGKGGSKLLPKHEDDVLSEILGSSPSQDSNADMVSDIKRAVSSGSCSNLDGEAVEEDRKGDIILSTSDFNEMGSSSPDELRQQALEEKKKYRILKGEGKSYEALQAFKRGKELERQAGALDLALRKSRRKASTLSSFAATQKTDDHHESGRKDKLFPQTGKEEKDNLAAELKELGWSDTDLHNADKRPVKVSLEGELSSLLGEIPKKSSLGRGAASIDKTQVLAHKKKALMFKREGKLAEAKEELKKAKVLEKQQEEQELLGEADESDDELSTLIHSMDDDDDKQDHFSLDYMKDPGFDMANLAGVTDDLDFDGNFNVSDDDMNDPEIAAALKSFGWTEDVNHLDDSISESVPINTEALRNEVLSLKREALNLKRAGNVTQAMEQLKKAKLIEQDLEQSDGQLTNNQTNTGVSNSMQRSSNPRTDAADDEIITTMKHLDKAPPKSKLVIQKELLNLKKKALALRREGRLDEADEELKKGKVLERQLEELENAPKATVAQATLYRNDLEPAHKHWDVKEGDEENVTEQDMHDPALLSVLKNLGWEDEQVETISEPRKSSKEIDSRAGHATNMQHEVEIPYLRPKGKADIQKELLFIKRKALALRREGKLEEAEEELRMAKVLEAQMAEIEAAPQKEQMHDSGFFISQEKYESVKGQTKGNAVEKIDLNDEDIKVEVSEADMTDPGLAKALQDMGSKERDTIQPHFVSSSISVCETSQTNEDMYLSVAKHVLSQANESVNAVDLLTGNDGRNIHFLSEKSANDGNSITIIPPLANTRAQSEASLNLKAKAGAEDKISSANVLNHMAEKREKVITDMEKAPYSGASSAPVFCPQNNHSSRLQEVLALKRKAVALKRDGKLTEAREELRKAKFLEKSLEEVAHNADAYNMNVTASTSNDTSASLESSTNPAPKPTSSRDRFKLQQESLAHKRQALKLRREGRMEESEAEFELAKALETQLEEMGTHDLHLNKPKNKMVANSDVDVEDFLDPQLLSALKAIGCHDIDTVEQAPQRSEAQPNIVKNESIIQEKGQLEERIKVEKVRALNLKRAGKQAEALDALRQAKQLEKQLISMTPHS